MKVWGIIFNFHGVGERKCMECVWMDLNSVAREDLRGKARLTATASQFHNQLLPGKSVLNFFGFWIGDETQTLKLISASKFGA